MIEQSATFCDTERRLDICKSCERHIANKANKHLKKYAKDIQKFKPVKTEAHEHCDAWVIYPIKEKS